MTPLVLNENKEFAEKEIKHLKVFAENLNVILKKFKKDTRYSPTMDEIRGLIMRPSTAQLEAFTTNVSKIMNEDLDEMKITGQLLRDKCMSAVPVAIEDFSVSMRRLWDVHGVIHVSKLTLIDGCVYLTKEGEEKLRDAVRLSIKTEKALKIYNLHKAAAQKIYDLMIYVNKNTPLTYISLPQLVNSLFKLDVSTGVVKLADVDYDYIANQEDARNLTP